jgi:putative two-component system response regulator
VKILIVDDSKTIRKLLANVIKKKYSSVTVLEAGSGEEALETLTQEHNIEIVFLDVVMPGIDGFKTCEIIKSKPYFRDITIIFLTGVQDEDSIVRGFELGGADYITKPFKNGELLARVNTHIELRRLKDKEIEETQKEVIFTMGTIGETRSKETGNHVKRVAEYSKLLAKLSGMSEEEAELLKMASPMHDIGKIGIPDSILHKPGRLNENEFLIMQTHATMGYEMLKNSTRPILQAAAIVAHEHHEKYDGSGYPHGLEGKQIHIYGRITAIADTFDALGSARVYKEAWPLEKILDLFVRESGKHYDPELVDIFLANMEQFLAIRDKFVDVFEERE